MARLLQSAMTLGQRSRGLEGSGAPFAGYSGGSLQRTGSVCPLRWPTHVMFVNLRIIAAVVSADSDQGPQ